MLGSEVKKIKKLIMAVTCLTSTVAIANSSVSAKELAKTFEADKYDGCFILYNLTTNKIEIKYETPNKRCDQSIPTNSTFKIPLALMAFDQHLITESTVFKWDGKTKSKIEGWNQDQTPYTWQKYSVVWVSQQISPKIGLKNIKNYLAKFNYGNQDFSGNPGKNDGLTHAWLSSSLKISAIEQLEFLKNMNKALTNPNAKKDFGISQEAVIRTNKILLADKVLDNNMIVIGKTGSGWQGRTDGDNSGKLRDGWFVGFVGDASSSKQKYIVVTNVTDKVKPKKSAIANLGAAAAKPSTLNFLNSYFKN